LADGLGKGVWSNPDLPAARIITWAGFDPGTLGRGEKIAERDLREKERSDSGVPRKHIF
jgi:hypothetical protein